MRETESAVESVMFMSTARLSRLEDLETVPPDRGRRSFAVALLIAYDFDPADFELSFDDIPAGILSELTCAARDSNPEPADSRHGWALAA
jgi:hypothetical protein